MNNYTTSKLQNIARILLGASMIFAGISHLTFMREEFFAQVPSWLPQQQGFQNFVVLASGVVEISFGLALIFLTQYKMQVGVGLAIFFVLIFPGNISQYVNHIDAFGLDTDDKRFNRLFFQPVLIAWALWSTNGYKLFGKKKKYWN